MADRTPKDLPPDDPLRITLALGAFVDFLLATDFDAFEKAISEDMDGYVPPGSSAPQEQMNDKFFAEVVAIVRACKEQIVAFEKKNNWRLNAN